MRARDSVRREARSCDHSPHAPRLILAASRLVRGVLAAVVAGGLVCPAFAQPNAPGGFIETATSSQMRAPVRPALPARGPFTFPAPYGTTGVRITNASDCAGGTDCLDYVGYSYWRNMNYHVDSDSILIFLTLDHARGGGGPTLFSYNKLTDQVTKVGPLFDSSSPFSRATGEGWYWSGRQASKLYVVSGAALYRYDINTRQLDLVFDATAQFGSNRAIWQTHSSEDDAVHSATLRDSTSWEMLGCLVYSESTKQFSYFPKTGTFDECQVDKSGRWLLIKEQVDNAKGEDNVIVNLQTGAQSRFLDQAGAAGHSDNGYGYMVASDNWNALPGAVRVWRFDQPFPSAEPGTPPQGLLVYRTTDWSADIGHLSHASARPGVALDQQYVCGGNASRNRLPRNNEILCFRLDGSLQVLVVAPVMTDLNATGGGSDDYAKLPKGNLDVTGQYFIWTSNAGSSRLDAFLVKVPAQLLGVSSGGGGGDTTAPTVSITAPGAGSTMTGSVTLSASASDNVAVAGVQFKLDGATLGPELTAAPFSMSWNTTGAANGAHTLSATARDSAGNSTTSAGVSVTVANTTGGGTFSDTFNRPDSTVLGSGWQEVQGDLLISYSELRSTTAKGNNVGVISLAGATQIVGADFASTDNKTAPRLGVILRYQDPQNYYLIYRRAGGTSVLRISRIVSGVETTLASASIANPVGNAFFHLTGRATGTTLTLELDGMSKLSVSDSRFSSGRVGILLGSSGHAAHRADNFSASAQ